MQGGWLWWLWALLACLGLALITLITRAFFLIPERELRMPQWLRRGLKYAPVAALAAVVAPEVVLLEGQMIGTLLDARLPAALVAGGYFFWRGDMLGTIASGMLVYLPLHIGLGW